MVSWDNEILVIFSWSHIWWPSSLLLLIVSLSHGLMRQWDSHDILLVSYMLTLLIAASHCLLVSWSHETMKFSWYSLGLLCVNPPHRCFSLSPYLMRQWDSHDILLVSYTLTLLTAASHCLLVSWSHETMRFSWYSLGLIYVNPPHRCFSLSPCLMVSWDNEILMIFSWSPMC